MVLTYFAIYKIINVIYFLFCNLILYMIYIYCNMINIIKGGCTHTNNIFWTNYPYNYQDIKHTTQALHQNRFKSNFSIHQKLFALYIHFSWYSWMAARQKIGKALVNDVLILYST